MINIYKASAGSGKTHTLTRDYLFLVFENQLNYRNILAVTFTNKAAGEMKERIIDELSIIAQNPKDSAFLNDLKNKFTTNENILRTNANIILKKILHNYTFFNISTIDSFVQKVIRSFAFELKIPASYKIELDNDKVSTDLTDIVLSNLNDNKNLQKWLTNYAYERISEGKRWNFRQNIIDFSKQLFNEKFYGVFDENVNSQEEFNLKLTEFTSKLNKSIAIYEKGVKLLVDKGLSIVKTSGIENVSVQKIKFLRDFFFKNNIGLNLEISKTLATAIEENDFWNKTTKDSVKSQWTSTLDNLREIILEIFNFDEKYGRDYYTAQKIKTNLYTFGVINSLKNEMPAYRDENNLMLIIDLTLLLKKIIGDNDAPFIYEKIGNRYSHIMIDEFQDTSSFQWHNFKPLIANTLATNNYNLIVGDVKQSIYRWRNGDWKLLYSGVKNEIGAGFINEISLDTNWRSRKEIVEFNNALFSRIPILMQEKVKNDLDGVQLPDELSNLIPNAYKDTYQEVAKKNLDENGYVHFEFMVKQEDLDEDINEKLKSLVLSLLETHSPGDIAILVRRNSEANDFMKLMLDLSASLDVKKQFNVVSAESLLLSNSMAVRTLVNVFKIILNETVLIHLFETIADFNRLLDIPIDSHDFFKLENINQAIDFLPFDFINNIATLKHLSLFELAEKIISIFKLTSFKNELPFIRSFEELINGFIQNNGSDLKSFVEYWDENQHKFSVQLSEIKDAMQIMTLHKSKGLAFKIVIMPLIDWKLEPTHYSVIWGSTEKSKFNDFPFLPINTTKDLIKTDFADDYISEKMYSYMDAINMLYVAFTRAKDQLYGFVPLPKKINGGTIGEHVFMAIQQNAKFTENSLPENLIKLEDYFVKEEMTFEFGNQLDVKKEEKDDRKSLIFNINNYPTNDWTENIAIVTHSEDLIAEMVSDRQIAIKQGLLMHELFSLINTTNDIETALNSMKEAGKITEKDAEKIEVDIKELFENEQIKSWFSDEWNVFSEKEILTKYGDTKIPDRVITNDKEVIVIDYKFGHKRPEHKRQINRYIQLLKDIEKDKIYKGFLLYADEKEVVEV
ncbi:MAG: UvrD-helicase domain-containing protein [Bacteroidales bacterium]|nr:UvrD-helicase domain-containing protein [Bacteroidales bacterium]